jgi:hypothetical protein
MKLDFSFLETSKNRVTTVTTVTPADDAACIGNPSKSERVTRVTFSETPEQEVTQVTQVKTVGLPTKPANDAEVTQVTQVTRKNIETEKEKEADRPEPMALHCSDGDRALLAEVVNMLTDDFLRTAPGIADQIIRAFNTVEAAERAGDQESFNFALNVLRSVVDDARQLAPGETCGGVAYG